MAFGKKWFSSASDSELASERERVRKEYCSSGDDFSKASKLQKELQQFDREMSKRSWGDKEPTSPSTHREHGWYLSNDD